MSHSATRTHGLGTAGLIPLGTARRVVERSDIDFALAKRALGWGWQSIALALRVNQTSLRDACEGGHD